MSSDEVLRERSKIYWFRMVLGLFIGVLCTLLKLSGSRGLALAIVTYILSIIIAKNVLPINAEKLEEMDFYKEGIGVYFISWMFFWVLTFNLANVITG
ncbi:hypothetical protein DRO02_01120 [archaeon]|nr:MAG: hypothetical protein DRO02_01120 [archaeon]HDM23777.1 hypothetical protein [Candidatus Bathyarchaeota archaeon]